MTAANFKTAVRLHHISGIPRDDVVNDWYFHWDDGASDPLAADFDVVAAALTEFYSGSGTGITRPVGGYISEAIDRAHGPAVDIYKIPLVAGPLGSPVYSTTCTVSGAGGGHPYPAEVAICLSFRSDYGSDVEFGPGSTRPRSSHRGRVYVGPIEADVALDEDATTHEVRPNNTVREDISQSARLAFSAASPGLHFPGTHWTWGQFSHAHWIRRLVTECWVDDEFDIQRRRGLRATTRNTKVIT